MLNPAHCYSALCCSWREVFSCCRDTCLNTLHCYAG